MPDTLTKPPGNRPEDDRRNPVQHEFDELIRHEYAPGEAERAAHEQAEALRREEAAAAEEAEQIAREASGESAKSLEEAPAEPSDRIPYTGGAKQKKPAGLRKRQKQIMIIGGIFLSIAGGIVSLFMSIGSLIHAPQLAMKNPAARITRAIMSKRTERLSKRYFQVKDCTGKGAVCRMTRGVSDKEIKRFKDAGILSDEGVGTDEKGRKYIKFFDAVDDKGNKVQVNANNFADFFKNNTAFKAAITSFSTANAMLARGAQSIKLFVERIRMNLRAPFGEKDTTEDGKKSFRAYEYGQGGDSRFKTGSAEVDQAAAEEATKAATNGPNVIDNVDSLKGTATQALDAVSKGLKGAFGGVLKGALNSISVGCEAYSIIRKMVMGAKIIKAFALIKYAVGFFTEIERAKAGHAQLVLLAFLIGILMKPSKEEGHKGETFFNSNGKSWILEGKVAKPDDLARFAIAAPRLSSFNQVKNYFQKFGFNKSTCSAAQSTVGQIVIIGGGLLLDFLSGGTAALASIAAQAGLGFVIGFAISLATPWLIQYVAGTVAPDYDHPGGGQAAGEAIFAGISAVTMFTGRASGMRPMTKGKLAEATLTLQPELASLDRLDHWRKSPFSFDEPDSIPNKLAYAVAPYAAAPLSNSNFQNLAQIITSPFSLVASSFNSMLMHKAHAAELADLKGQYCGDDDYAAMDLAVDAGCGVVHALTTDELNIDDAQATKYLQDNGQFDDTYTPPATSAAPGPQPVATQPQNDIVQTLTGLVTPKKASAAPDDNLAGPPVDISKPKADSDLKKYIDTCINGEIPYSPDGGGIEVTDDIDTRQCLSDDQKYQMYRVYAVDTGIVQSTRDDLSGTLGTNLNSDLTP